jgi:hypothetical protein
MTAAAHASTTTTVTSNSLSLTGSGTFSYEITTTAGFSEPLQHASFFVPGANSGIGGTFTIDQPANYSLSAVLNGVSFIEFASFANGYLLNQEHLGSAPKLFSMSGFITPGKYQIGVNGSQAGPSGLPNGINRVLESGAFSNFSFVVQVPEPSAALLTIGSSVGLLRRRAAAQRAWRRCAHHMTPPMESSENSPAKSRVE